MVIRFHFQNFANFFELTFMIVIFVDKKLWADKQNIESMAKKIYKNEKNIASRQTISIAQPVTISLNISSTDGTGKLTIKMLVMVCGVEGDDSH
jgi:hypothetical protein